VLEYFTEARQEKKCPQPRTEASRGGASRAGGGCAGRYAEKALADELAALGSTAEGDRNNQVNRSAFNLGQLVAAGRLSRAQAEGARRERALRIGLAATEAGGAIGWGRGAGMMQPRADRRGGAPAVNGKKPESATQPPAEGQHAWDPFVRL